MDPLKEAFNKIKEEIYSLKEEIRKINEKVDKIPNSTNNQDYSNLQTNSLINNPKYHDTPSPTNIPTTPTHNKDLLTQQTNKPTNLPTTPTHNNTIQPLYTQNTSISIGNDGVPTNTPTNTPTHQHTKYEPNFDFKQVNNILESLDVIKKEIRIKFKRLTQQEMLVFSTLYTLENQNNINITYKIIAEQLKLSESSIRDYTNKLIKKGIPIEKTRQNNKTIILKISKDLKNIATLTTIQSLRTL